jgi:hypothetical protein
MSLNSGFYALDNDHHANIALLDYERTLHHAIKPLKMEGLSHQNISLRLSSKVLLTTIDKELRKVARLKEVEWNRQHQLVSGAAIDTSWLILRNMFLLLMT